jgi:hypothetical protein
MERVDLSADHDWITLPEIAWITLLKIDWIRPADQSWITLRRSVTAIAAMESSLASQTWISAAISFRPNFQPARRDLNLNRVHGGDCLSTSR